jgi:hypothetical protein
MALGSAEPAPAPAQPGLDPRPSRAPAAPAAPAPVADAAKEPAVAAATRHCCRSLLQCAMPHLLVKLGLHQLTPCRARTLQVTCPGA